VRKYIKDNNLKIDAQKVCARKKFEKEHINELWIADCLHGPHIVHEKRKKKVFLMLLTGEPGTGKTLYLRTFVSSLNENLYKYFYLPLSTVNTMDFYRQI